MTSQEDSQVASACGAALASSCEVMVKVQDSMNTILESVQVTNLQTQIAQKETRLELLKLQLAVQRAEQNKVKVQCSPEQCQQSSEKAPAVPEQLSAKRKRTKHRNNCRYFQVCNLTCLIIVPPPPAYLTLQKKVDSHT